MNLKNIYLLGFILSLLTSCAGSRLSEKEYRALQEANPIQKAEYWNKWKGLPLEERVFSATPEMIEFLQHDNDFNGYPNRPTTVVLTKEYKKIIKAAIGDLPSWIKKPIEKKIIGIMILEDLGGSALTDSAKAFKEKGFIVFDIKTLTQNANDWCSWKENSAFKGGEYYVRCILEDEKNNNIENAFRYIFLHEAAHILNIGSKLLPFWRQDKKLTKKDTEKFSFLKKSWVIGDNGYAFKKKKYKKINHIRFYKPKYAKKNSEILEVYKELKESDFPTLYGTLNVWDDFAESYVNYIHTEVFKKPYEIEVFKGKKKLYSYKACWKEERCKEKAKVIAKFLKEKS